MLQERKVKHVYLQCTDNTVFEALLKGEKIRSTSVQLNKSCSSEPSGSKVPLTATRLSSALSKAHRSVHNHHLKLSRESSEDGLTSEESHP